jgi:hypothetical protein
MLLVAAGGLAPPPLLQDASIVSLLWPADVTTFRPIPGSATTLSWNATAGPAQRPQLRYEVRDYTGAIAEGMARGTGLAIWAPLSGLLQVTLPFPPGFYEVYLFLASDTAGAAGNSSFGVMSLPSFVAQHPSRDPVFSIEASLTEATGYSYRPDFAAFRGQLIEVLGAIGVASVRETNGFRAAMDAKKSF